MFSDPTLTQAAVGGPKPLAFESLLVRTIAGLAGASALIWWSTFLWMKVNGVRYEISLYRLGPAGFLGQILVLTSLVLAILAIIRRSEHLAVLSVISRVVVAGAGIANMFVRPEPSNVSAFLSELVLIVAILALLVLLVMSAAGHARLTAPAVVAMAVAVIGAVAALVNAIGRGRYFIATVVLFVALPLVIAGLCTYLRSRVALTFAAGFALLGLEQALHNGRNLWLEYRVYGNELESGRFVAGTWLTNFWTISAAVIAVVSVFQLSERWLSEATPLPNS